MNLSDVIQSFDPIKWIDDAYTTSRNGRGVLLPLVQAHDPPGALEFELPFRFGPEPTGREGREDEILWCVL